jgi:hypothetical protein
VDAAQDERDLQSHRPVKERQVLDRLLVCAPLGMDLLHAAIDRDGI